MKPNPHLVLRAVNELGEPPNACVLIGDSLTDIIAAPAVGLPAIGFANAREKTDLFAESGAAAIVTSMTDVATALRDAASAAS